MHTSKHTIKGYSVANKQKEEKVSLKPSRDRDYNLRIAPEQMKNSVSLKPEKEVVKTGRSWYEQTPTPADNDCTGCNYLKPEWKNLCKRQINPLICYEKAVHVLFLISTLTVKPL